MDNNFLMAKELPMAIEVNEPISKPRSHHVLALFSTLLLFACVGVGVYLFLDLIVPIGGLIGIIVGGYILYLIMAVCCNKTGTYLRNSKSFQEYEEFYYKLRDSRAYFRFDVQCYHFETHVHHNQSTDANGNTQYNTTTQQRKVVTHTATENLFPSHCQDISGHIEELYQKNELIFFKYVPRFQFDSLNSQRYFENSYDNFKMVHNRDVHQDASFHFVIPGLVERVTFYTKEEIGACWFYVWGILGMGYFYSLFNESKVSRYEINIVKRITF